jgi:hypothetical protein
MKETFATHRRPPGVRSPDSLMFFGTVKNVIEIHFGEVLIQFGIISFEPVRGISTKRILNRARKHHLHVLRAVFQDG